MLTHLAWWQRFHGPLVAFAVAFALALAGRFLRLGLLATVAGAAGVVAGWFAITGRFWTSSPVPPVDELTEVAAITLLIGLFCAWLGPGRLAWLGMALAALAVAWLLSGAPLHLAALRTNWPISVGIAVTVLLFARILASNTPDPLRLALAGLTLAVALHVAGAPPTWTQLALVPAVAALAMFAQSSMSGPMTLPIIVDVAALCCVAVIGLGRLPRLAFGSVDAAALSPLLAVWLQPRTMERLSRLGRAAPLAGCLMAGAIAVGCVWLARQALNR